MNELLKALKSIDINKFSKEDKFELLIIFNNTKSALLRNQLAFIFSDMHFNEAIPYVLKKIHQKNLYNKNGSLVYALTNMETTDYFESFIKIICEQDYEARLQAFEIIVKDVHLVSKKTKKEALKTIEEYRVKEVNTSNEKGENSRLHFIEQTKKLLLSTM